MLLAATSIFTGSGVVPVLWSNVVASERSGE